MITAALLLGTVALIALAWSLRTPPATAPLPPEYRTLTAPFPAGSIAGRVFAPAGYEATSGERPSGCERNPLVAGSGGGLAAPGEERPQGEYQRRAGSLH